VHDDQVCSLCEHVIALIIADVTCFSASSFFCVFGQYEGVRISLLTANELANGLYLGRVYKPTLYADQVVAVAQEHVSAAN
jgi:hypothetical protein